MSGLPAYAEKREVYDVERLESEALHLLQKEQSQLQKFIDRNVFLNQSEG